MTARPSHLNSGLSNGQGASSVYVSCGALSLAVLVERDARVSRVRCIVARAPEAWSFDHS